MNKDWSKISLIFFLLIALIGTLLRSTAYVPVPVEYQNLLHAHSHVAFQGWIYTIMFLFLTELFLTKDQVTEGKFPLQFKVTVIVVAGVLISFTMQSYRLFSIIVSTLFQLLNYWFIYRFLKAVKRNHAVDASSIPLRFIKTGLWLALLSTTIPYAIGIISAKGLGQTEAYSSLVYSFLHLQYNGWFLFVVLGLAFNFLDRNGIGYKVKTANRFYLLLSIAVLPAITLSFMGMSFSKYILPLAYFAAIINATALMFFLLAIPGNIIASIKKKGTWFKLFFIAFLSSFVLKMILQSLSVLPIFRSMVFFNKFIIMAYMHLSLIGSVSFLFIALMIEGKWLSDSLLVRFGSILLVFGFVFTELILVLTGLGIYYDQLSLPLGSATMALGVLLMLSGRPLSSMKL